MASKRVRSDSEGSDSNNFFYDVCGKVGFSFYKAKEEKKNVFYDLDGKIGYTVFQPERDAQRFRLKKQQSQ